MKIFVLNGVHFEVPGNSLKLFATMEAANVEAAVLTNMLLEWVELPKDATAENWQHKLRAARLKHMDEFGIEIEDDISDEEIGRQLGNDDGDVWITEEELQGLQMMDYQAANGEPDTEGQPPIDRRPWAVEMDVNSAGISVHLNHPDAPEKSQQRSIWIEIADHTVVAHCYDPGHDEPLNIRIGKAAICTDHDRDPIDIKHFSGK